MTINDCPFCSDSIETSVFSSSDSFNAIYNIAPILPGHSLIVPKRHIKSILELSNSELQEFILFSKAVTEMLMKLFKAEAFNWSLQEGIVAGQTVEHMHWHIVLRYKDDMPEAGGWYPKIEENFSTILDSKSRGRLDIIQMEKIVTELRCQAQQAGLY